MPIAALSEHAATWQITCIGLDAPLIAQIRRQLPDDFHLFCPDPPETLFGHFESGGMPVDSVVIGLTVDDAVRLAQRIHIYDKLIPIIILSAPATKESLHRTLMFSPFLGNEVAIWSTDELDILPAALRESVNRRRQRLTHRNTLAKAQIRLEKLPLQQPEATHYLDRLLDHAPIGVMTVDRTGTIVTVNLRAQQLLVREGHRALGQPLLRFFPNAEHQRLNRLLQPGCDGEEQCSDVFALHGPDEERRCFVEITSARLSYRTGQRGRMLILQDVSSRMEAEKNRQQAEEDLRLHAAVLRRFHEITSSEELALLTKIDRVLQLGCTQFGLSTGLLTRLEGDSLAVIRSVGDAASYQVGSRHAVERTFCGITLTAREPLAIAHASGEPALRQRAQLCAGQEAYIGSAVQIDDQVKGTLCFFGQHPRSRPFSSADSELVKLISRWVANELQRERAESLMRKLSGALERTADAIMITDRNRYIEYVNPSFERLTGYSHDEVIGKKTYFLRSGLHDDKFYDELWQVISKGQVFRGRLVNRKKDGTLYHEQKTISPLKDESGHTTHYISAGHDITDLIEAEERYRSHQAELAHVARLSTLGEMTSGLAHELNQPLCAIKTYAQTCLHVIEKPDCAPERVRYGLEQVVKQAELASAIFRRLRDFSRKGDFHRVSADIKKLLFEVVEFVAAEAQQKRVFLERSISPDLPAVYVDPIQIEQVLLNLVRNAIEAVSTLDESRRHISLQATRSDSSRLQVEVRDSGAGCPPDMVDRLFEPFVTSKPEGLGIGLSISQSIVEAHGGNLWLEENSNDGAIFCFTLPTGNAIGEEVAT